MGFKPETSMFDKMKRAMLHLQNPTASKPPKSGNLKFNLAKLQNDLEKCNQELSRSKKENLKIKKSLEGVLELRIHCPVCDETPTRGEKISQCENGHIVCNDCTGKSK